MDGRLSSASKSDLHLHVVAAGAEPAAARRAGAVAHQTATRLYGGRADAQDQVAPIRREIRREFAFEDGLRGFGPVQDWRYRFHIVMRKYVQQFLK